MKFIAERDTLLSALSFVGKYTDAGSHIPILSSVKFDAGERGVLVCANDLEQSALDSFSAHVERPGALCLQTDALVKIIKSTDASEVLIDADDRQTKIQIGGRTRLTLAVLPAKDFPANPALNDEAECNFTIPAELFSRHAKEVSFALAKDDTGGHWAKGTLWEIGNGLLNLVGTDRVVLSRITVPAPAGQMPRIIVPAFILPEWSGDVSVSVSSNFIRFSCGRQIVASKLIAEQFPDYQRILPDNPNRLIFDRTPLQAAVNRMGFLNSRDRGARIILFVGRDGKLSMSVEGDGQEMTDEIPYDGPNFQIALSQRYLSQILASFDCETIEWRFLGHDANITIHDPEDDSRIVVAFPYRDSRLLPFISEKAPEAA